MQMRSAVTQVRREETVVARSTTDSRRRALSARRRRRGGLALALVAPAALAYLIFVIRPIATTVQYSF
jgi:raffinose/stachyose/melibiose transport system permease protein